MNSFILEKSCISISVPMQDTFLFKAMKETHEHYKTKIDIDELITGPSNITFLPQKSPENPPPSPPPQKWGNFGACLRVAAIYWPQKMGIAKNGIFSLYYVSC